jgi:hypothetical protein
MFFECYKIKKAPDFSGSFNLSQINSMFEKCVSLKDFPNINNDNIILKNYLTLSYSKLFYQE